MTTTAAVAGTGVSSVVSSTVSVSAPAPVSAHQGPARNASRSKSMRSARTALREYADSADAWEDIQPPESTPGGELHGSPDGGFPIFI
jgi:hypothetical protein